MLFFPHGFHEGHYADAYNKPAHLLAITLHAECRFRWQIAIHGSAGFYVDSVPNFVAMGVGKLDQLVMAAPSEKYRLSWTIDALKSEPA